MTSQLRRWTCALMLMLLGVGSLPARAQSALDWAVTVDEATARLPGLRADRLHTLAWLAAFNALNAIEPRYRPYAPAPAFALPVTATASGVKPAADAALAAAIFTTLAIDADVDQAVLARKYREAIAGVKSVPERDAGVALGQQAALLLLAGRSGDRLGRVEPPALDVGPGLYVQPEYAKMPRSLVALRLAPFGVRSASAFTLDPPPAVGSVLAAREIVEVRRLGGAGPSERSGDQTAAALYWNSIESADFTLLVRQTLEAKKADALDIARAQALLAMISTDTRIVGTMLKERYLHWRPQTAITGPFAASADREADWQSLVRTPADSEYPSGGATFAGTMSVWLPRLLAVTGTVELRDGQTGQTRRWNDPSALAAEMAASRVWAGVHFRSSTDAGQRLGRAIATEILDRQLLPR